MYIYSDPERESEPHALPDIEVFYLGDREMETGAAPQTEWDDYGKRLVCNLCGESWHPGHNCGFLPRGYYWQACFPGCLPDGEPVGPFETEEAAIKDAQDYD